MSYGYKDHLSELNIDPDEGIITEKFSISDNIDFISPRKVLELFSEVSVNENMVYVPVNIGYTIPVYNNLGRGMTYSTARKSLWKAKGSLVNVEHLMKINETASMDTICGHAINYHIRDLNHEEDPSNIKKAIPLRLLLGLYKRSQFVPKIVEEHASGKRKWFVSWECEHKFNNGIFVVDGEKIPVEEANEELLKCYKPKEMASYRGKDTKFLMAGEDGVVNFVGIGLTRNPAEKKATILNMFVHVPEAASAKGLEAGKIYLNKDYEDEFKLDSASIQVIGETEPASSDGHKHKVLSNGMIEEKNGHSHFITQFVLTPGISFTAVTSPEHEYLEQGNDFVHFHLIDIDLKKKVNKNINKGVSLNMASNNNIHDKTRIKLNDLIKKLKKDSEGNITLDENTLIDLCSETAVAETGEAIEEKMKEGELVDKEKHEEEIREAKEKTEEEVTKKKDEEYEKEKKDAEVKNEYIAKRIQALEELGIAIDDKLKPGDEKSKTFKDIIGRYNYDDDGQEEFETFLSVIPSRKKSKEESEVKSDAASVASLLDGGDQLLARFLNTEKKDKENKNNIDEKPKFGKYALSRSYL